MTNTFVNHCEDYKHNLWPLCFGSSDAVLQDDTLRGPVQNLWWRNVLQPGTCPAVIHNKTNRGPKLCFACAGRCRHNTYTQSLRRWSFALLSALFPAAFTKCSTSDSPPLAPSPRHSFLFHTLATHTHTYTYTSTHTYTLPVFVSLVSYKWCVHDIKKLF